MIKIENIYKSFEENIVLNDISLEFEPGKCNLIIGSSGSGKTVLMKVIVGLMEVDQGDIYYDNIPFNNLARKEKQSMRSKMGMLFQGGALFDSLNVEENIMFPLNMFTNDSIEDKRNRVRFCLDRVGLENVTSLMPAELSGGMKKRVAIARAISISPNYLFADEPNSGLDPKTAIKIDALIKEITEEY
ncbi:MAG TPA: ATP-binding cassette domain-containing protein, partial [Bacteroidales bacterium]|nr:ATP-binding cassette domain-containing protein [Bacteroidales bacterium]